MFEQMVYRFQPSVNQRDIFIFGFLNPIDFMPPHSVKLSDPNTSSSLARVGTDYCQTHFLHTNPIINWYGQTPF